MAPSVEHILSDNETAEENLINLQSETSRNNEKIFLNPTTRDTLLTNLINGSYTNALNGKNAGRRGSTDEASEKTNESEKNARKHELTVARRDSRINSGSV